MARADRVVDESRTSIRDGIARLDGLDGFAATSQLRAFETAWKRQDALLLRARRLSRSDPERATALFNGEQQSAVTSALRRASLLGTAAEGNARARSRDMQDAYASSSLFLLGSIALAAVLGLGIAFLISRGIQRSVEDVLDRLRSLGANCVAGLRDGLGDLAHGDLTTPGRARPRRRSTASPATSSATSPDGQRDPRRPRRPRSRPTTRPARASAG